MASPGSLEASPVPRGPALPLLPAALVACVSVHAPSCRPSACWPSALPRCHLSSTSATLFVAESLLHARALFGAPELHIPLPLGPLPSSGDRLLQGNMCSLSTPTLPAGPSCQWLSVIRRHLASSSSYLFLTPSPTQSVNTSCLLCLQLSAAASRDAATMVCCRRNDPVSPYLGSRPPPSSAPAPPTSHAAAGTVSLSEPQKEAHHCPDDRIESKNS